MNKERLTKLAEYLDNLEEGFWNFSTVTNAKHLKDLLLMCSKDGNCGTTGCALGHVPCIWPDTFRWYQGGDGAKFFPVYVAHEVEHEGDIGADIQEFLDIDENEFCYFFEPRGVKGCYGLVNSARQYDVAERIRDAVNYGLPDFDNDDEDED